MIIRNVLSIVLFLILVAYGPVYEDMNGGIIIRIGYLIILPLALWFLVGFLIERVFHIDDKTNDRIERMTWVMIGLFLIYLSVRSFTAKDHIENTMVVQTIDGYEAVGDDIRVKGPDYRAGIVFLGLGLTFSFIAVFNGYQKKRKPKSWSKKRSVK